MCFVFAFQLDLAALSPLERKVFFLNLYNMLVGLVHVIKPFQMITDSFARFFLFILKLIHGKSIITLSIITLTFVNIEGAFGTVD